MVRDGDNAPLTVAVRGIEFHFLPWARMEECASLELEMVPEPGNPWDKCAVAMDFQGSRIGYLPSELGKFWQPYVQAKRRKGTALYLPAILGDFRSRYGYSVALEVPSLRTLEGMKATLSFAGTKKL